MSSLSLRVLELFDENRLSLDETEKLLQALSAVTLTKLSTKSKRRKVSVNNYHIPPHAPSYMDGLNLDRQI